MAKVKNHQNQLPEGSFATAAHQQSLQRQEQINSEINALRESLTEEEQLAQLIGSIAQKGQSAINQVRETVRDIITLTGDKELMTAFLQKMSDTIEEIGNEPTEAIEASEEEEETYDILTDDDNEDNDEPDNDEPEDEDTEDTEDDELEDDLEEEEYEPKKQPTRLKTAKPKRPRRSPVKT